jgi:hypothetical protein
MTQVIVVRDTVEGKTVFSDTTIADLSSGIVAEESFSATAGQTVFQLASNINATQTIDAYIDGRKQEEGGGAAWTRNDSLDQITFTEGVTLSSWVFFRIFQNALAEFNFTVPGGGQTIFPVGGLETNSIVTAYIDGRLQREGASHSYTRDAVADTITFSETVSEGSWVQIVLQ